MTKFIFLLMAVFSLQSMAAVTVTPVGSTKVKGAKYNKFKVASNKLNEIVVVRVDYSKKRACYSTRAYDVVERSNSDLLVTFRLRPIGGLCRPDMLRDIQNGIKFEIEPEFGSKVERIILIPDGSKIKASVVNKISK